MSFIKSDPKKINVKSSTFEFSLFRETQRFLRDSDKLAPGLHAVKICNALTCSRWRIFPRSARHIFAFTARSALGSICSSSVLLWSSWQSYPLYAMHLIVCQHVHYS
jgi:hypothetical protein